MILSVFCWCLIQMVGPPKAATAAAAALVLVTNCRRSIPFRLPMDLPSSLEMTGSTAERTTLRREPLVPGLDQIVYCVLSAIWDAFLLPLFQVVFAPKYSSPTA